MNSANKKVSRSAQSPIRRVERRHPPKVVYLSEPRDWVQYVISEAKKNKDFKKKKQFLSLLKDRDDV